MSIKSTHEITRETAMQVILMKIPTLTDTQLASMLEEFEESYFRNYTIVSAIDEPDEWGYPLAIRNINEF